jgi:prefoldin subunit 5
MNCSDTWLPRGSFEPRRYRPGGIGNWSGHLPFANDLVAAARPELLVELGTHYGESYFGFCQAVAENNLTCKCYAIDTWLGEQHAGFYDETVYQDVSAYNDANYSSFSYLLRTTFDEGRKNFSDDSIDILHVDGLHTYNAVLHDFENWLPAVKPGGIVLLHDTVARHADFGVWKVWDELEKRGERFSFLHSWGLGVFRKPGGKETNSFLSALFAGGEQRRNHIRQFHALCGRSLEYGHFRARAQDAQGTTALLQVYPEQEGGYSPEVVYDSFFKTKEWEHVRVDLISGSVLGRLRIDITERTGVIDVAGISVRKAVNDEQVFRATGAAELAALKVGGTMTRIENAGSTEFCRYISSGSDPQLFVELEPNLTDQPLVLDLWVRVDSEVTILLPSLTGQQRNASMNAEESETVGRLRDAGRRVVDLEGSVSAQRAAVVELQHQKNELENQKNELKRELDSVRKELESLTSAYRRSQSEFYVMKRDLVQASDDNEKLRAEINASKDIITALSAEHSRIQAAYRTVEESCAGLESTLRGVLSSRSWRVTEPMRRLIARLKSS